MGLKAGWLALFVFVWIIGIFLGSTFDYSSAEGDTGISYNTGTANFTYGSATVVGNGTTWAATMVGGLMQATNDGVWVKIFAVPDATTITLTALYPGDGGNNQAYTIQAAQGWAGTGDSGYSENISRKIEKLTELSVAYQENPIIGTISLPVSGGNFFSTAFEAVTWQWSFLEGYEMFYYIFCLPFVIMGILSMVLLVYGVLTGNLTLS